MEYTRLGYFSIYMHGKMVSIRFYLSSSPNACLYMDRRMLFIRCIFFFAGRLRSLSNLRICGQKKKQDIDLIFFWSQARCIYSVTQWQ